jgi:NADP-dependent 3-hydroxy acid dehydrogenase YdfG
MSSSKHDKEVKANDIKPTNVDTTKIINQTFDDAKNKARKAIDETHMLACSAFVAATASSRCQN